VGQNSGNFNASIGAVSLCRSAHGTRNSITVLGDDDQGHNSLGDHIVDLVVLQFHIVIGLLGNEAIASSLPQEADEATRF
jgi:hypothetical protein